jgi:hypothetical protein
LITEVKEGHGTLIAGYAQAHGDLVRILGQPDANIQPIMGSLRAMQEAVVRFERSAVTLERMTPAIEEAISRQVDRQTKDLHTSLHGYTELLTAGVSRQTDLIDRTLSQLTSAIVAQDASVRSSLAAVAGAVSNGMTGAMAPLTETGNQLNAAAAAQREVAGALSGVSALPPALERLITLVEQMQARSQAHAGGPEGEALRAASQAMESAAAELAAAAKELRRRRAWKFWS